MPYAVEYLLGFATLVLWAANFWLMPATMTSALARRLSRIIAIGVSLVALGWAAIVTTIPPWNTMWDKVNPNPAGQGGLASYIGTPLAALVIFIVLLFRAIRNRGAQHARPSE